MDEEHSFGSADHLPVPLSLIRVVLYEENTGMKASDECESLGIHLAEWFTVRYPNPGDVIEVELHRWNIVIASDGPE